jgi:exonuclease SbcC
MQFYAMRFHNFFRFGEEDNSVVLDMLPEYEQLIANGDMTLDELYDQIMLDPLTHIQKVKEAGLTNMIAIAGVLGNEHSKSNGTGKSTIFEGICYLLYEKIVRKTANNDKEGKAGLSVVANIDGKYPKGMKESFVEGLCEESGKLYRIKRGRTFTGTHKSSNPLLEFESYLGDGEIDPESSHRTGDTAEAIAQVVNYDYDVFVNSAMFGQSDAGKFLVGTDKVRKEMLINVLRLEDFVSGCLDRVRKRKNAKEKEILKLETEFSLLQEGIEEHVGVAALKQQIKAAKDSIKEINETIAKNEKAMAELSKSELVNKANEIKELGLKIKSEKEAKEEQQASQVKEWEELLKKAAEELLSLEDTKIPALQKEIQDTKASGQKITKLINEVNLDQANAAIKKAETAKAQKDKFVEGIAKLQKGLQGVMGEAGEIKGEVSRINKEVASLESQISNVDGDEFTCSKCKSKVSRQHIEKEIQEYKSKLTDLQKQTEALEEKKKAFDERIAKGNDRLDTIVKAIASENEAKLALQAHEHNKVRVGELKEQITKDKIRLTEMEEQAKKLKTQKDEYASKIESIKKKYESDIADLTKKLSDIRDKFNDAKGAAQKLQGQIDDLKALNETKKNEKDAFNTKIGSCEKDIQTFEATQKKYEALTKTLEEEKKVFERLIRLDGIFGLDGIQTRIVIRYLPLLNAFVKEFLDVLSEGQMLAEIVINKHGKVDIIIKGGAAPSFVLLSGGEKMLVRLAIDIGLALLTFSRCAQKPEIICLDEIFGPLDDFHVATVFALLKKLQTKFNRVMLISHKDEINEHMKHKLLIEKTPGNLGRSRVKSIN